MNRKRADGRRGSAGPPNPDVLACAPAPTGRDRVGSEDLGALERPEAELTGRRRAHDVETGLGGLDEAERRELGGALNAARTRIETLFATHGLTSRSRAGRRSSSRTGSTSPRSLPAPGPGATSTS